MEVVHHRRRHQVDFRGDVGERHAAHAFVVHDLDGRADDRIPTLVELVGDRAVGAWSHALLSYFSAVAGSIVCDPLSWISTTRNLAGSVVLALREISWMSEGDS